MTPNCMMMSSDAPHLLEGKGVCPTDGDGYNLDLTIYAISISNHICLNRSMSCDKKNLHFATSSGQHRQLIKLPPHQLQLTKISHNCESTSFKKEAKLSDI